MAVSLALRDTVESLGLAHVSLKWPNDLYLADRKAAGVLIQNTLSGNRWEAAVVGIGLNVNQTDFDPALPNPVSLAGAQGRFFDVDAVAHALFERLERRYLQLKSGAGAEIKDAYESSLYRLGLPSHFIRADGTPLPGLIRGVTEAGYLRLETDKGEEAFEAKSVQFAL
jgi:BirA family biotin operon repressor/biotin-[acetyl-CoA-carboxylase] ligase